MKRKAARSRYKSAAVEKQNAECRMKLKAARSRYKSAAVEKQEAECWMKLKAARSRYKSAAVEKQEAEGANGRRHQEGGLKIREVVANVFPPVVGNRWHLRSMSLRQCSLHSFDSSAVLESSATFVEITQHVWGRDAKLHDRAATNFIAPMSSSPLHFEQVFGIYDFPSGPHIALLVESESYVSVKKIPIDIRAAKKIIIVPLFSTSKPISAVKQQEQSFCLDLLKKTFQSHRFFYSTSTYDITHHQQSWAMIESKNRADAHMVPLWKRSDRRFFWNHDVVSDFMNLEAHAWIVPFVSAHIEFKSDVEIDDKKFDLLFISRRSCFHQGCRFTKRGLDSDGNCANFVETEQTLILPDGKITSLVQVRGSIPILWSSPCTLKYEPSVSLESNVNGFSYSEDHFKALESHYCSEKQDSIILCVNLIDKKRDQEKLGFEFAKAIESVKALISSKIHYEWFDFHAETKKSGKWKNLVKLLRNVESDIKCIGFFCKHNGEILSLQKGVIRTNCMDNLDRTNVAQTLFARYSLLTQIGKPYDLSSVTTLESPYKKFEKVYKDVWANNADAISKLYAGTGALKVDFTKTGKRTTKGMFNDLVNSIARYYINNFSDGRKQDGIDILLGKYKPTSVYDVHSRAERLPTVIHRFYALFVLQFSIFIVVSRVLGIFAAPITLFNALVAAFTLTLIVFFYVFFVVFKFGSSIGRKLVVRAALRFD